MGHKAVQKENNVTATSGEPTKSLIPEYNAACQSADPIYTDREKSTIRHCCDHICAMSRPNRVTTMPIMAT